MERRGTMTGGQIRFYSKHYNIMTSCDETLLPFIPIQLASISSSLPDALTDFYLFHRGIPDELLRPLSAFSKAVGNITFHSVIVREAEKYDAVAAHGGGWPGEAYFSLCAGEYLPGWEERVLYIDAGDVLVEGDIAPYYDAPFGEHVLTVHLSKALLEDRDGKKYLRILTAGDLESCYAHICFTPCLFNSGSYVINLDRQRRDGKTMDDFVRFSEELCALPGVEDRRKAYWGDQGFLSALYAGRLNYFGLPEHPDIWYQPYDFLLSYHYFNQDGPDYEPVVIHYTGSGVPKPWNVSGNPCPGRFPMAEVPMPSPPLENLYHIWQATAKAADYVLARLGY